MSHETPFGNAETRQDQPTKAERQIAERLGVPGDIAQFTAAVLNTDSEGLVHLGELPDAIDSSLNLQKRPDGTVVVGSPMTSRENMARVLPSINKLANYTPEATITMDDVLRGEGITVPPKTALDAAVFTLTGGRADKPPRQIQHELSATVTDFSPKPGDPYVTVDRMSFQSEVGVNFTVSTAVVRDPDTNAIISFMAHREPTEKPAEQQAA